ncbi:glucosamine-6-phosphate deaminase [Spiroplasma helicoides]|uniref:Glucosamine-6-phosphate deaminase n=1 Tax=Spiroplasma helicoides TaxID=216938 RepID=A0A1B3SJK0_9MOLU|nr:glucosamine-6-phosphate deaminase [Spiroplasma helicoides]AOG60113.1 glucosamine-6-phosphate deaminase [Spiroplasma helicoides]
MKLVIVKDYNELGKITGDFILEKVKQNPNVILGLATGSSPITTYEYIIEKTKENNIDWSGVKTFNLDEYVGLTPDHEQSYRYFMEKQLFEHINIKKENTHVPNGLWKTNEEAAQYDEEIKKAGGIDLQLLGIGQNGHIGFNEPGASFDSITSIVDLTKTTIEANSRFFEKVSDVPTKAVSMGLKSIMNSKEIILIASGANKTEAIKHLIKGEIGTEWPCTVLQNHPNVTVIVDQEAAKEAISAANK